MNTDIFTVMHADVFVWAVVAFFVNWNERKKTRKQILDWLRALDTVQKQLLQSCVSAARRSKRRIVEWRIADGRPGQFDSLCSVLLVTKAVSVTKYPPPGIRRYRFQPWLFDYLDTHPELLYDGG